MLILAGITLSFVIPEDGLIRKAVSAIDLTNKNEIVENIKFAIIYANREGLGTIKEEALNKGLTDKFGANGYELEGNKFDGWTVTIPDKKLSYMIDVNGNVTEVEFEEKIDNTGSLVLGFVDDLGTRATIYLYGNSEQIQSGQITITMPDGTTKDINALEDNTEISGNANYATYTVAKNGDYTFKAKAGTAETETIIRVKNIEKFKKIDDLGYKYANSEKRAYAYNGASIPKGYYVDEKTNVSTGLVITDEIDAEGYSIGNEWVWVPVNSRVGNEDFYTVASPEESLTDSVSVNFSKYSKLYQFLTNQTTNETTKKQIGGKPSGSGYREPAILTHSGYGEVTQYKVIAKRGTKEKFSNLEDVANQYVSDYDNMLESVNEYRGFFIGRYEITDGGEKPGTPIGRTGSNGANWYYLYNKCLNLGKEYSDSGMVYGALWDAMMQWLVKNNYIVTNNISGYGNTKNEDVFVLENGTKIIVKPIESEVKLQTGKTSYTRSINIYDLTGNCMEWTQEAYADLRRVARGGHYYSNPYRNYRCLYFI